MGHPLPFIQNEVVQLKKQTQLTCEWDENVIILVRNSNKYNTCNSGKGSLDNLCQISLAINFILTFNGFEAILLYFCYKAVKQQNEESREMIGQDHYQKRKRQVICF